MYCKIEKENEIRFGKFSKGGFTPFLSLEKYLVIKKFMNALVAHGSPNENTTTEVLEYIEYYSDSEKNTFRISEEINIEPVIKKITKKKTLKNTDNKKFGLRFSSSSEENISPENFSSKDLLFLFAKTRKRTTYIYKNLKIDLSAYSNGKSLDENDASYDVEIELGQVKPEEGLLDWMIQQILKIIQESFYVMDSDEISKVNQIKTKKFLGVEVVNICPEKLKNKKITDFWATMKMDGKRKLFIDNGYGFYCVDKKGSIMKFAKNSKETPVTIIDGELCQNVYHCFDILFLNGEDLRELPFESRLSKLKSAVEDRYSKVVGIPIDIRLKEYIFDCEGLVEKYSDNEFLDGIIYVEKQGNYFVQPLKWKPRHMNTIDFKVIRKEINEKEELWELYCSGGKKFDYNSFEFDTVITKELSQKFKSNVLEFTFDINKEKFIPFKERFDKTDGNYIDVARDNFIRISSNSEYIPFTSKVSNNFFDMRRFHNWIKRKIISQSINPSHQSLKLLDLACGKGGDIHKWIDNNVRNVEGYDISEDSINQAKSRFSKVVQNPTNKNFKFNFHVKDLNKESITGTEDFDTASCFFAIHYFTDIEKFTKNFKNNLKKGGYALITVLCSDKLKETNYSYSSFNKELKISKTSSKKLSINVTIKNTVLDKETKEYIVDHQNFVNVMESQGFILKETKLFSEYYPEWANACDTNRINYDERYYSFMNRTFVFQKM